MNLSLKESNGHRLPRPGPAAFVQNRGQVSNPSVKYYTRSNNALIYLTSERVYLVLLKKSSEQAGSATDANAVLNANTSLSAAKDKADIGIKAGIEGVTLALNFIDASPQVILQGRKMADGILNFFYGNDPSHWQTGVALFEEVVYRNLWPGIDLFFRLAEGKLKYEFIVQPGADPEQIRLGYQGADEIVIDGNGNLVLKTALGDIVDEKPAAVSVKNGQGLSLPCSYQIMNVEDGLTVFGYRFSEKPSPKYPLVIDPAIYYSTFIAGTDDDYAFGIEIDSSGCAYVAGWTLSNDFPVTPGAFQVSHQGAHDVFVTKINPTGSGLIYSTFIGGSQNDEAYAIAVDDLGNAYVCGSTDSPNFPVTPGAFQTSLPGNLSGFVLKLNPAGNALTFSSYLGGSTSEHCRCVKVDNGGNVYVTGETMSPDFPVTPGAFQTARRGTRDAFAVKMNPNGSALAYSTLLGGSSDDMALDMDLDSLGQAYLVGLTNSSDFPVTAGALQTTISGDYDAFVTKLNAAGSGLIYSTYLGGTAFDQGTAIEVDDDGCAYVTGFTVSDNFPTTPGSFQPTHQGYQDIFVSKLNPSGSGLVYSTYIGGPAGDDLAWGIDIDYKGCAVVVGETFSHDYPVTPDAVRPVYGGFGDAVLTKLNPSGSALVFSSYSGGVLRDIAYYLKLDSYGDAYIVGMTQSHDFPATPGSFQPTFVGAFGFADAFVTKLGIGYHPSVPGQAYRIARYVIDTGHDFPEDSQQLDADFFLVPDDRKVVYGTVRFPDGTPVPAAVVKFFKVISGDPETTCELEPIGHAITDDCGTFLLGPLPTGVNVVIKTFFLTSSSSFGTPTPGIGTATPLDP